VFPVYLDLYGAHISIWELMLLAGAIVGYIVLSASYRVPRGAPPERPSMLGLRYLVTVYVAVIAAQFFSYAFDYGTTLAPPAARSPLYYYFSPTAGAKTLYGAIVALPLAVGLACAPWRGRRFAEALDRWTPAMFSVMAVARLGCWFQGCCYGVRSEHFGLPLAPGSVLYYQELHEHLIDAGSRTLAVVPTQAISALVLAALAIWAYRRIASGGTRVFAPGIAVYSVFRFMIEIVRDDPARNALGPLSTSQWIALAVLAVYAVWRLLGRARRRALSWPALHAPLN